MSKRVIATTAMLILTVALAFASSPMRFELQGNGGNCSTCSWILAEGEIMSDTADKFRDFLQGQSLLTGDAISIRLNSPGGSLIGGIKLGEAIRENKFST